MSRVISSTTTDDDIAEISLGPATIAWTNQYVAVSDDRMGSVSSGSIVRVTRRFPRGTYVRAVATRVSRRASSSAEALREESDLIVD